MDGEEDLFSVFDEKTEETTDIPDVVKRVRPTEEKPSPDVPGSPTPKKNKTEEDDDTNISATRTKKIKVEEAVLELPQIEIRQIEAHGNCTHEVGLFFEKTHHWWIAWILRFSYVKLLKNN